MQKTHKNILLLTTFLFILSMSSSLAQKRISKQERPNWIDSPPAGTFIGISDMLKSEQDARNQAIKDGKRQIIESLGGVIESEFVDNIIEKSGETDYSSSYTESKVKIISKNILSVKPIRTFTEKYKKDLGLFQSEILYKVYVLIPFSKAEHHEYMTEIISQSCQLGEKNFKKAIIYCENGQFFRGLDLLQEVKKNLQPMTEITGLQPAQLAQVMEMYRKTDGKLKAILTSINYAKRNQEQQSKFGRALPRPLETYVFWINNGNRIGISNLEVEYKVSAKKAKINSFDKTNSQGIARCKVNKVLTAGDLSIRAIIHFPEKYGLDSLSATYNILSDNIAFVQVIERNFGNNPDVNYLQNSLNNKLNNTGFKLIDNTNLVLGSETDLESLTPRDIQTKLGTDQVDFAILGKISTDQSNKIQDGFYFAWADGVLKVVNLRNMEVLDTYQSRGKAAGNSELNAGTKSIAKTSDILIGRLIEGLGIKE